MGFLCPISERTSLYIHVIGVTVLHKKDALKYFTITLV